jgi:tellurite resistance protein TerC
LHITSVFLVFLVIGSTDVVFAVDSIPAIIGVIREGARGALSPGEENFVAVTSNVFAVMGLVSLFFALRGIMDMFRYLKTGVSVILFFVGAKMLLVAIPTVAEFFHHHAWVSLAVIAGTLAVSILLSLVIGTGGDGGSVPEEVV